MKNRNTVLETTFILLTFLNYPEDLIELHENLLEDSLAWGIPNIRSQLIK